MDARTISLVCAVAGLTMGCGGAFDSSGDGGATDSGLQDGSPPDAGGPDGIDDALDSSPPDTSSPWSPVCPASAPSPGSACTQQTVQCEYGDASWNVACDVVLQCTNDVWTTIQPSYVPCTPKPGPNPAACPPSFASVPQGAACGGSLTCSYPQGVCTCQSPLGGPPPPSFDGGPSGYWACVPEPGCPMPRPRLGSACSLEGTFCTYETCAYGQTCINGTWQSQSMACAQGAAAP
jgi:hypothetical protein